MFALMLAITRVCENLLEKTLTAAPLSMTHGANSFGMTRPISNCLIPNNSLWNHIESYLHACVWISDFITHHEVVDLPLSGKPHQVSFYWCHHNVVGHISVSQPSTVDNSIILSWNLQ